MNRETIIEAMAAAMRLGYAQSGSRCWDAVPERIKGAYLKDATAALAAIEAAGVRLVPVEATEEMIAGAWSVPYPVFRVGPSDEGTRLISMKKAYAAFLAASPYAKEPNK